MSNTLPSQTVDDIRCLAIKGMGVRAISRALGISKYAAAKYYPSHLDTRCPCGKSAGHRGWCKHMYAQSIARQAFQASRSGRSVTIPPPIKLSRQRSQTSRQLRWLGLDPKHTPEPVQYAEMYSIIGEAHHAGRKFPVEFKDDAIQETIVAACEGRILRSEIERAARFFMLREWRRFNVTSLSIDQIADGRGYDVFLIDAPWQASPRKRRKNG